MRNEGTLESRLASKRGEALLGGLYGASGVDEARQRFKRLSLPLLESHGEAELRFYSAPGRTELAGNHTDHNRGRVICAAVSLDALACAAPTRNGLVTIASQGFPGEIRVELDSIAARPAERGTTAALVRGTAAKLAAKGIVCPSFEAHIDSRVIVGSGLSSSAAIEMLLGVMMTDLAGAELPPLELAKIGQAVENEYFGKPCGLMDQAASASGGIVAIDFRDPEDPVVLPLDFDFREKGYRLVVIDTGGDHADLTEDYAAMPAEMRAVARLLGGTELRDVEASDLEERGPEIRTALGDRALLRAFHFFDENDRVVRMVEALRRGKIGRWLKLVRRSGDSSWRLLQNLHAGKDSREQGLCVAIALSDRFLARRGVSRVHGGGLAGTIQAYVPRKLMREYRRYMESWFGAGSVIELEIRGPGACRVI
jgi:galactokinase